jgi:G3E family GTPase
MLIIRIFLLLQDKLKMQPPRDKTKPIKHKLEPAASDEPSEKNKKKKKTLKSEDVDNGDANDNISLPDSPPGAGDISDKSNNEPSGDGLVPVTLLCGFLGSGKTTLLKHILETKHSEEAFKAAVIVNDMAELNIDKALIDKTSLIQSDEAMIGMQNGCICCTLQNDLVDQITKLALTKKYNYILIEASGVSEPHEIAPLFELDDHEHDHDDVDHGHDHDKPQLGEVARLDTCVTLIDSADFYNNLGSMKSYDQCDVVGTIAELMMDQVEFANVILLNKVDLVNEEQQVDLMKKISLLNPKAKIVKSVHSNVDVMDLLNTRSYKDKEEFWVTSTKTPESIEERAGRDAPEACTSRFDIKSFVYRARRPFHPGRINDLVLEPFFMPPHLPEDDEDENGELHITEEEKTKAEEILQNELQEIQEKALSKQKHRTEVLGEILRSKGFFWNATSNDVIGGWQQAGNILRIGPEDPWLCLVPESWEGTPAEKLILQEIRKPDGEEWEYKDRRQEIVFIGHGMKREAIQSLLDQCLLTDEEMALGPVGWKETMEHLDKIELSLGDDDMDEEEEGEEDEEEEKEQTRKRRSNRIRGREKTKKDEDEE